MQPRIGIVLAPGSSHRAAWCPEEQRDRDPQAPPRVHGLGTEDLRQIPRPAGPQSWRLCLWMLLPSRGVEPW